MRVSHLAYLVAVRSERLVRQVLLSFSVVLWAGCSGVEPVQFEAGLGGADAGYPLDSGSRNDAGGSNDAGSADLCRSHESCGPTKRCALGRCIPRPQAQDGFLLERARIASIEAHWSGMPVLPPFFDIEFSSVVGNLGFGGALFDIDGDRDLDLFLGTQGHGQPGISPACIYENVSQPTALEFQPMDAYCGDREEMPHSGFGVDLEADGYHELVVTGLDMMELHRFHPEHEVIDLKALVPVEDGRANCNAGAGLSADLNRDGRVDLVLGCQHGPISESPSAVFHLVFLQTESGGFELLERENWDLSRPLLLHAHSVTLGLGGSDVNGDGLLDLLVCEDHLQGDLPSDDPGGVYLACAPNENCRYRAFRMGDRTTAYGNYMGAGIAVLEGHGPHLYFSNIGANRFVDLSQNPANDRAVSANVDLAGLSDELPWISWGVVIDDFNRDGRDDILVSQGSLLTEDPAIYEAHFDALLIQRDGARFSLHSEDIGLEPFTADDSDHWRNPYSGRAIIKADLDYDGMLDLIQFGVDGRPRIHREVPVLDGPTARCTLIPKDRYVHAFGMGHELVGADGVSRAWDVQGQLRSGASPFVVSPWRSGHLRFPSGVLVPFDCGESTGAVVVEEPTWFRMARQGRVLRVRREQGALPGVLQVWVEPQRALLEAEARDDGDYLILPDGVSRMMLKFGERWLARYYPL